MSADQISGGPAQARLILNLEKRNGFKNRRSRYPFPLGIEPR